MRAIVLLVALSAATAAAAPPCRIGPYVGAGNFAADLDGAAMSGPRIWGRGAAWTWEHPFLPPDGYRVRVLELSGDLTARLTTRGSGPAVARPGEFVGVLVGAMTLPVSSGSTRAEYMADDTLVYRQADVSWADGAARTPFRQDLRGVENAVLGPDHKLYWKAAKYLDETGLPTHLELTFTVVYQFEREDACDD